MADVPGESQTSRVTTVVRHVRLGDEVGLQANCKTAVSLEQVRAQVELTVRDAGFPRLAHFVAARDDEVVGNVMLMALGAHVIAEPDRGLSICLGRQGDTPQVGRLDDYVVASRLWRQGIGTMLTSRVIEEAGAWGLARLETSSANPAAITAFQRQGFTKYGELPLVPGDTPWHGGGFEALFFMDL